MTFKVGDRVRIVVGTVPNTGIIIPFGMAGTVIQINGISDPSDYRSSGSRERLNHWVRLDGTLSERAGREWYFAGHDLEPHSGHYRMTDPECSLDEIHAAQDLMK